MYFGLNGHGKNRPKLTKNVVSFEHSAGSTAEGKGRRVAARSTTESYLAGLQRRYGITPDEYRALLYAQGGRCYVCRKARGKARRLGVDHDHLTGEVRGLVCTGSLSSMTCNRLIAIYGRAQLVRAVEMLSDPPPARAVLAAMRRGQVELLPMLIDDAVFNLSAVRGVHG